MGSERGEGEACRGRHEFLTFFPPPPSPTPAPAPSAAAGPPLLSFALIARSFRFLSSCALIGRGLVLLRQVRGVNLRAKLRGRASSSSSSSCCCSCARQTVLQSACPPLDSGQKAPEFSPALSRPSSSSSSPFDRSPPASLRLPCHRWDGTAAILRHPSSDA